MMDEMIDSTYADLWPDSGVALRINRLAAITMELRRLRVLASAPPEAEKGQESVQKALNLAMVALHKIAYGRARYTGSRTAMEALQQITEVTSGAPPEASEEPEKDHDE